MEFTLSPTKMSWLESIKEKYHFDQIQWIPLDGPKSFHFYQEWLDQGHFGEMSYLQRHAPSKEDPKRLLAPAQSVIMVAKSYVPSPQPHGVFKNLRVASYAQNKDYHDWLYKDLQKVAQDLQELHPEGQCLVGTDSIAFLERDFAAQAGLGWVGKNTCIIDRKQGSFFFLGEILTSLPAPESLPSVSQDFCGTCSRCIEICPTQALEASRRLIATKCISYWTIESKTVAPREIRENLNDWFFGCDLCQSVCPWNQKPFASYPQVLNAEKFLTSNADFIEDLRKILTETDENLKALIRNTPFERSKPFGLRRNALYVAGNRRLKELEAEIMGLQKDSKLGELADWALEKIKRPVS